MIQEFADIPEVMREARRWLLHKNKIPYYVNGEKRHGQLDSPEDLAELATFENAASKVNGVFRLGFALGPDGTGKCWQGIDLDKLSEHPALSVIVDELPGYTETSPSGNGLHAIGYGRQFKSLGSNASGIEAYSSGRYFTMTGEEAGLHDPVCIADFVEKTLIPMHSTRSDTPDAGEDDAHVIKLPDETLKDLRSALTAIDADDRAVWIRMGNALKELGKPGGTLWVEYSQKSASYDSHSARVAWDSFKPHSIHYQSVFDEAARNGWMNPKSVSTQTGDQSLVDDSEDGIALLFAENHPQFRWVQEWGRWFEWDGVVWLHDKKLNVYTMTRELIRNIAAGKSSGAKALKKATTVSAVEKMARCDPRLVAIADQWDTDIFLLNTDGGIVDLIDGKLLPHDPLKYMTRKANCNPGGDCPGWLKFLGEVTRGDQDLIAFLQRVIGYSLTGSVREHALFFFYGTGRNGKGVFLNTLVNMLSDYAGVASVEMLMETFGDRHPTELAGLMGKRLVIAQEVEEGGKWAEARIKTLTGGDPITARYMRQDFFTFEPQFKLLIAGNHKPAFRSIDEALRARLHLIPFTVTIPKEKRDPDLPGKLREEWGGILQWCIDGAVEYQHQGLNPPEVVRTATDEYFSDQDTMQQWIDDCCDVGEKFWETPTALFNSWKHYAKAANFIVGSQKDLKTRLDNTGYLARKTGQKGRFHEGIRVKYVEQSGFDGDYVANSMPNLYRNQYQASVVLTASDGIPPVQLSLQFGDFLQKGDGSDT